MLFFDHLDHFAPLVFATVGADAVRELGFVAVRAFRHHGPPERIVGAARRGAALGMSAFGIRHNCLFFSSLGSNTFERRPTVVSRFRLAVALR